MEKKHRGGTPRKTKRNSKGNTAYGLYKPRIKKK